MEWWEKLSKRQRIIAIIAGITLLTVAIVLILYVNSRSSAPERLIFPDAQNNPIATDTGVTESVTPKTYFIEVLGNVKAPGVYELNRELMVLEAIELAGGFLPTADLIFVHKTLALSKKVAPYEKIYIPGIGEKLTGDSE